ncbi:MAG: hypothetical protein USCAAHI_00586 [Beijerinckiaceae bacterium]|nr:MAG: hypothetical protein USCAAHI_00586 [Beijerinckiaceae bacterium]
MHNYVVKMIAPPSLRTVARGLAARHAPAAGVRRPDSPKTLLDPEMTDIAPSPMSGAVESADERVTVISENRKRRLAPRAKPRRNLGAQSC